MKRIQCIAIFALLFSLNLVELNAAEVDQTVNNRYCNTCHGADGRGNFGIQAPRLAGMESWYLRRQLENFREGIRGVHPQDIEGVAMRPMATKLSDESITDIIEWVESWEYVPAEKTIEGNERAGAQLYTQCASCHGANAEGNEALGAPALSGQNDWYLVTQLKNFREGWRGSDPQDSFGQQMMMMTQALSDDEAINNVVSYINSLRRNL